MYAFAAYLQAEGAAKRAVVFITTKTKSDNDDNEFYVFWKVHSLCCFDGDNLVASAVLFFVV